MWRSTPYADAEAMPTPSDPHLPTRNFAPVPDETTLTGLSVEGTLPPALTGRYLRIGPNAVASSTTPAGRTLDGMVHAVELHAGRAVRYRNRWVTTDNVARTLGTDPIPGPPAAAVDTVATNVITFGGRTLALGPGALAYELDDQLATLGRVDLAGHGRGIGAHPQIDPLTGALHLVSYGDEPAHHIVSPNSHTRITVPVPDVPGPLLRRPPDPRTVRPPRRRVRRHHRPHRAGGAPLGRRRPARGRHRQRPRRRCGRGDGQPLAGPMDLQRRRRPLRDHRRHTPALRHHQPALVSAPTYVWTVAAAGGTEVYRHDLRTGDRTAHDLGPGRHPGAMTFVPDPTRLHREDGGWLVGFAHDDNRNEADLIVLDAAAIDHPPVATVAIPRRIPYGLHGTWIPAPVRGLSARPQCGPGIVRSSFGRESAGQSGDPRPSYQVSQSPRLDVVVEGELVGVGAEAEGVDLVGALVADPGVDEVVGEDATDAEEVVVGLEGVEGLLERAGHLRHLGQLLGREVVEVLVHRRRRLDAVGDAVEAGEQHRREGEVRVRRGVGAAELDPLGLAVRWPSGMRHAAERLRCEYTRFTGAS